MSFCPRCGFDAGAAAKFCSKCGKNLQPIEQLQADNQNILGHNQNIPGQIVSGMISSQMAGTIAKESAGIAKSTIKAKILAVTLIGAIVTAGIILYNMYFVTKPIDVVNKLFNAMNEKDLNTVMQCLDPSQEKLYNATSAIVNKFVGVSLKDMVDLLPALLPMMAQDPSVNQSQIVDWHFSVEKIIAEQKSDNEDTLRLMVREEVTERSGKKNIKEGEGIVRLKKFNAGWRIVE